MKKFQFLSAAAVALLLASCSSDAPDAPQPVNGDNNSADMMYMSLSLKTTGTRADNNAKDGESTIDDVTLYIFDKGGNCKYSNTTTDIDSNTAYYQVSKATFKLLAEYNDELNVYVVCNAPETVTPFYMEENDLRELVWTVDLPAEDETGRHIMTGAETLKLNALTDQNMKEEGNSRGTAWKIVTTLGVDRLTARLDYAMLDEVTLTDKAKTTFKFEGVEAFNINDREWLFHHGASKYNDTAEFFNNNVWDAANNVFVKETSKELIAHDIYKPFAVPTLKKSTVYHANGSFQYVAPRTNTLGKGEASFADVTYVVMKYSFTNDFTVADLEGNYPVLFVYDGEMIGGVNNFAGYTNDNSSRQNLIRSFYAEAKRNSKGDDSKILDELKKFNDEGLYYYEPEVDETNGAVKYFTYYFKAVSKVNPADYDDSVWANMADGVKYGVLRNHVYTLRVNSISGFGKPGQYTPNDIDPTQKQWWIDMTITVNNWTAVANDFDL